MNEYRSRREHWGPRTCCSCISTRGRRPVSLRPEILFWRTAQGAEVDIVIEQGSTLLPIEVKTSSRARRADARGLEEFLDAHPQARLGLLVYDGTEVQLVTRRVVAAPIAKLL